MTPKGASPRSWVVLLKQWDRYPCSTERISCCLNEWLTVVLIHGALRPGHLIFYIGGPNHYRAQIIEWLKQITEVSSLSHLKTEFINVISLTESRNPSCLFLLLSYLGPIKVWPSCAKYTGSLFLSGRKFVAVRCLLHN